MSKKKVSRAVMTLKDFHGGSIPSDLPLPSAPGMAVERSSFERQGSGAWMSPVGRAGYGGNERNSMGQNRQGLGNAIRGFEDKASLFPNPANIGRNYDEDERKPVDGRPRSSHSAEQYEEHTYDERPRSGHHDKTFNRFSPDEHGYRGMAPAASYGQSSQVNKPKPPVSPPPPNWRQPPQQPPPTAGFVDRNSGPNVWPARQESEVNQMPADLVQNQSQVSVPWRTQTPKSKTLDLAMPDNKASPKSWQPEQSYGGESTGWQGHGHSSENPERSHFSRQQAMYPDKNINPRGYASGIAQMDGRVIYGESYGGRGAYSDGTRPGFGEGGRVGENSRVQGDVASGGYADAGGYGGDDSGSGFNGTGAIATGGASYDPGNRIAFFDVGRTGRVENEFMREPSHPEGLRWANSSLRTYSPGEGHDSYGSDANRGAVLPERNSHSSNPHESQTQRVYEDQGDRAPAGMGWETRRSPPLVESNRALSKERSAHSSEGYWVEHSPSAAAPADASVPRAPLVLTEPVAERPKLKLLPRSKPLESNEALGCIGSEVPAIEETEKDSGGKSDERRKDEPMFSEDTADDAIDASGFVVKGPPSNFESGDGGSKLAERPKLNLKPRSQPLEAGGATGGSDRSWDSVFGGARPRELVLRARGANDFGTAGENHITSPPSPRIGQIPGSGNTKLEQQKGGRSDRSDSWGEEKQVGSQPYEHQGERFMERQGSGLREQQENKHDWLAPSNHLGDKEWKGHRDSEKQDNKDRYEVNRPYDYQNSHSRGTDRQESTLRGAHKADGWRRPTSPIPVRSPAWTPSNSSTAQGGHHSFNAPASALELAKAFSRSSSIGSPMAGITQSNSGDQRHSVNLISRGQGYGPGSMKGHVSGYDQKDVSFSRLAESPPASSPIKRDVYIPGSGYGGNRSYNRFGGSKNGGGFGSAVGDMNSRLSYG